jgi:hypothetical protein
MYAICTGSAFAWICRQKALPAAASVTSIFLSLSAAFAQQPAAAPLAAATATPLFQGVMVDAKGKTVGRLSATAVGGGDYIIRQINGTWVEIPVDPAAGFVPFVGILYYYQSSDCTGQAYLLVSSNEANLALPAQGVPAIVPPSTEPMIYFAGTPTRLTIKSRGTVPGPDCNTGGGLFWVGIPQSVPVSGLGLTLPFSVK